MKKNKLILLIGLLCCVIGLGTWIYQGSSGLGITSLSNSFPWGLYVATFEFFVGAAAGGMLIFSLAYILRLEYLKPVARVAALTSFACTIAAGAAIMSDIGLVQKIYQILLTPNLSSPLVWDIAIMAVFAIVALLAVIFQMRPVLRQKKAAKGLPAGQTVQVKADETSEKWSKGLAYAGLVLSVALGIVTALLFSTQNSYEWWNSAIFPFDSVAVGYALGAAAVILFSMMFFGKGTLMEHEKAYGFIAKIAAFSLLAHYVLTAVELVPLLTSNTAESRQTLDLLFGTYGWLYMLELILPAIAMVIFFMKKLTNRFAPLLASSLLVIVGAFAHKLMVLLPAFNNIPLSLEVDGAGLWSMPVSVGTFTEGSASFVRFWDYTPSLTEWGLSLLPIGIILVVVAGVTVLYPMLLGKLQPDTAHSA